MSDRQAMQRFIHERLVAAMADRSEHDDWVERERDAVVGAANTWAWSYGTRKVTAADVERIEPQAMGHVDYASKLALYVAEFATASEVGR